MILDDVIRRFAAADRRARLETLLDYSRKLRPLPPELQGAADREAHLVSECQTPVALWVSLTDGRVRIDADVPRESPTVRGFVSLLQHRLNEATAVEVESIPDDLLDRLGLTDAIGMMRTQGLTAILARLKRSVRALAAN